VAMEALAAPDSKPPHVASPVEGYKEAPRWVPSGYHPAAVAK